MGLFESLGGAVGGIANMFGAAGRSGDRERQKALDLILKIQEPGFDMSQLTAPELTMVEQMVPYLMEAWTPEGGAPTVEDSLGLRGDQLEGLAQMQDVAREGMPLVDRIAARRAQEQMAQSLRREEADALRSLSARGQLGGGDELAFRLANQQNAANMAADTGASLAEQAALRRLAASEGAAGLAGQVRGQDVDVKSRNAQLLANYQNLLSGVMNQARSQNAQAQNAARGYNTQTRNDLAAQNALLAYQNAARNQEYPNQLKQQLFGDQLAKAGLASGQYNRMGGIQDEVQATRAAGNVALGQGIGSVGDSAAGAAFGGVDLKELFGFGG